MNLFKGNILILGFGSVAQCALPLLISKIDIDPTRITIMDPLDKRSRIEEKLLSKVCYLQKSLSQKNYKTLLSQYLKEGDIFINLSCGVSSLDMITWSEKHKVLYYRYRNRALGRFRPINPVSSPKGNLKTKRIPE